MSVIMASELSKSFGKAQALQGLNLEVVQGEIHGFLGPNGSGKSTTIRLILGLLKKSAGSVRLFDEDTWRHPKTLHERLAYVPGDVNFWPNLTGGEIIDLLGHLRGGLDEKRRTRLTATFALDPTKKFRTYSKGNRQIVAVIAALSCAVPLYIFDEPTSGLDPLIENVFQDEVRALKQEGKTVFLSSHILREVEMLCDRATIIREGRTAAVYTLDELRREHENLESLFLREYELES